MKNCYAICFIVGLVYLSACGSSELNKTDYLNWVNQSDNGLIVEQKTGDNLVRIQYKPTAYMALLSLTGEQINKENYEKAQANFESLEHYTLQLKKPITSTEVNNTNEPINNNERINYYAFEFTDDVQLIMGQDTLSPQLFHFERTFGLSPFLTFSLAFDLDGKPEKDRRFSIYDRKKMQQPIELIIPESNIKATPKLKL